jgi:hypothetical protein
LGVTEDLSYKAEEEEEETEKEDESIHNVNY